MNDSDWENFDAFVRNALRLSGTGSTSASSLSRGSSTRRPSDTQSNPTSTAEMVGVNIVKAVSILTPLLPVRTKSLIMMAISWATLVSLDLLHDSSNRALPHDLDLFFFGSLVICCVHFSSLLVFSWIQSRLHTIFVYRTRPVVSTLSVVHVLPCRRGSPSLETSGRGERQRLTGSYQTLTCTS